MKRIIVVTDMALIRHIGSAIAALTAKLDALPAETPKAEVIALDEQINDLYKKLFALLPKGADEDEALLDLIIAADSMFGLDVNHECTNTASAGQWYH
jgi:hypothetical protein